MLKNIDTELILNLSHSGFRLISSLHPKVLFYYATTYGFTIAFF